jgi:hypothetical protein
MKGYQPAAGSECSAWTTDEVWNPVMQEILGQEQVTLLAVATSGAQGMQLATLQASRTNDPDLKATHWSQL